MTYGQRLGSGWTPSTIQDVWGGHLPGDYMSAGKSDIPFASKWAMDKRLAKAFGSEEPFGSKAPDMFERFMQLQKDPAKLVNDEMKRYSPEFIRTASQMGIN